MAGYAAPTSAFPAPRVPIATRVVRHFNLPRNRAVHVAGNRPGQPGGSWRASQCGDRMIALDGVPIDGIDGLQRLLDASWIGRECELQLLRRSSVIHVTIRPIELPAASSKRSNGAGLMSPQPTHPITLAVPPEPTDHLQGSEHARVTVVEYGDFECPSCKVAATTPTLLLERFPESDAFHIPAFSAGGGASPCPAWRPRRRRRPRRRENFGRCTTCCSRTRRI